LVALKKLNLGKINLLYKVLSSNTKSTIAGIELYRVLKKGQHINIKNVSSFGQFYVLAA
jgi:hypothetical protein